MTGHPLLEALLAHPAELAGITLLGLLGAFAIWTATLQSLRRSLHARPPLATTLLLAAGHATLLVVWGSVAWALSQ